MSPEFSIIILTVLAGAGQGLFTFLVVGDFAGLVKGSPLSGETLAIGAIIALILTVIGVAVSFLHLTHPERGIKTIRRWNSSWLSREALLLPICQGLIALYALAAWTGQEDELRLIIGIVGVMTSLGLYLATAMIYTEVRFIREWSTPFTPINFTLIGLASGGAAAVGFLEVMGGPISVTLTTLRGVFLVTVIAAIMKLAYYYRNSKLYAFYTPQNAIGVNHPDIRLMDPGVSYDHYNTTEYNYREGEANWGAIRIISLLLLFAGPLVIMMADYMPLFMGKVAMTAPLAALLMIPGAMMERWLFFVDGNHAQNLYYGSYKVKRALNPMLQKGIKGAPLPPT